jgi:hypothetical protein
MKGKKEELRIPMKFDEAVADFLKVKPVQKPKPPKKKSPKKSE